MTGDAADRARILFAVTGWDPSPWLEEFARAAPEREIVQEPNGADDPSIRYAVVWKHRPGILSALPNLEIIFSVGAGVDHIFADPAVPEVPIVRIISDDLTGRMSEYVVWQVLDHMRQGQLYRRQQAEKVWHEAPQPAAREVTVGILGLGVLGIDAAKKLNTMGFRVTGWSRTAKQAEGVECHGGRDGLRAFLSKSDIVVVLLPLTAETQGIVDRQFIAMMKRKTPLGGPVLINAGRGGLQVEADILAAFDNGTLMAASLDVFETEPLAEDSRLWDHPCVTITPHAAAASAPNQLVPQIVRQMRDFENGLPLTNLVDREAGY